MPKFSAATFPFRDSMFDSKPPRDFQRARLYEAEVSFLIKIQSKISTASFDTILAKTTDLLALPPIHIRWCTRNYAKVTQDYIGLRKQSNYLNFSIVHELVHHAIYREHGFRVAFHGPEFCNQMLWTFKEMFGSQVGQEVEVAYKQHNISY